MMKHYIYLCFLAVMLGSTVSCQQAEELTPTLAKAASTGTEYNNTSYGCWYRILSLKDRTLEYAYNKYYKEKTATIPSTIYIDDKQYTVTKFHFPVPMAETKDVNPRITSVTLPNTLTTIGEWALNDMAITTLVIPSSVTTMEKCPMKNCTSLQTVNFSSNVSVVPYGCFLNCTALTTVTNFQPSEIGGSAFSGCTKLTNLTLPKGLKKIGEFAFENCSKLGQIKLPEGLISIGLKAFQNCSLANLPSTLEELDKYALYKSKIYGRIKLPESLTKIGNYAFSGAILTGAIDLPSQITTIPEGLFADSYPASISLGYQVATIEKDAFKSCETDDTLTVYASEPPTINGENFFQDYTYKKCTLRVLKESVQAYKDHALWGKFQKIEGTIPDVSFTDATTDITAGTYVPGTIRYDRSGLTAGKYATVCMPFAIDLSATDCFSDVMIPLNIALYNTTNGGMLTILMDKPGKNAVIPAGQPFLAKLSGDNIKLKNCTETTIGSTYSDEVKQNMEMQFKVFNYDGKSGVLQKNEDLDVRFCGSFEAKTGLDKTYYRTFMPNGSFAKADNIGAFRAYVYKANKESQANVQSLSIASGGVADEILKGNYTIKGNQLIINR